MSRRDLGNIGLAFPHSVGVQTPQLDTAPDYESGGQEFESLRARQLNQKLRVVLLIGPGAIRLARVHNQVHDRAASATVSSRTAPLSVPREFLLSYLAWGCS